MTAYYLSEGKDSLLERIYYELYLPLAISITEWFERNFGHIVGEGWGVRNWFKPSREGEWTHQTRFDQLNSILGVFIMFIFLFLLASSIISGNIVHQNVALFYIFLILLASIAIFPNFISPSGVYEYMGIANKLDIKYIKYSSFLVFIWLILYLLLGNVVGLNLQQIIISMQQIIPTTILLILFQIFLIPWVETTFFVIAALPSFTKYFGIIPSITLTALLSGGIHFWILQGAIFPTMMSIFWGLIIYPFCLKYKIALLALIAHIEANTLALILNGLIR